MPTENTDQYYDQKPSLLKQTAGFVGTLAMWGVGLAAAHALFRRGKTGLIGAMAKSKKYSAFAAAAKGNLKKYAETGGSLSHVYNKLGYPGATTVRALKYIADEAPLIRTYKGIQKTTNVLQRKRILSGTEPLLIDGKEVLLGRSQRKEIIEGLGAKYVREMATIAPLFYAGEQVLGHPGHGAHERDREAGPAWYNAPGHVVNFAKWLPGFMAFDMVARGAFRGVPLAYHSVMEKGLKDSSLRGLTTNLDKIRDRRAASTKDNIFIQMQASWDAFKDMVGTKRSGRDLDSNYMQRGPGHSRRWQRTQGTARPDFIDWAKGNWTEFIRKKNIRAENYANELQTALQSSSRYLAGPTVMNLYKPAEGLHANFKNIYSILKGTGGLGPKLGKRLSDLLFTKDINDMPVLARLGGLKPFRLRHLKEAGLDKQYADIIGMEKEALEDVGISAIRVAPKPKPPRVRAKRTERRLKKQAKRTGQKKLHASKISRGKRKTHTSFERQYHSLFRGGDPDLKEPINTLDDLLLNPDLFWDPQRKKIVDLTGVKGYDVIGRSLNVLQKKFSFMDKFPMIDIFPFRAFVSQSMPQMIIAGKSVIPAKARPGYQHIGEEAAAGVVTKFDRRPGVFIRNAGKRTYTLFSENVTTGKYGIGAQNLFGMSKFDSQKMATINSRQQNLLKPEGGVDFGKETWLQKLRQNLYDKYDLFGGATSGKEESIVGKVMSHFTGHNRAWSVLSEQFGLRNISDPVKFMADVDSAVKLHSLEDAFTQAQREGFKVLGRDKIWKKLMKDSVPHDKNGKVAVPGLTGENYSLDDLLRDKPSKDGTLPIYDVLAKLFKDRVIVPDSSNMDTISDLIKYGRYHLSSGELPIQHARRIFTEYHIEQMLEKESTFSLGTAVKGMKPGKPEVKRQIESTTASMREAIRTVLNKKVGTDEIMGVGDLANNSIITRRDKAMVEMAVEGVAWQHALRSVIGRGSRERPRELISRLFGAGQSLSKAETNSGTFLLKFLKKMQTESVKQPENSPVQFDRVWDNYRRELGSWRTLEVPRVQEGAKDLMEPALRDNPYFWFHNDAATWTGALGHYGLETFGRTMDMIGLGWDRAKYNSVTGTKSGILNLWGRRLALAGGVAAAYQAVDTFTDVNPMFQGTVLDEGVTVALADQAVRARMIASYFYDFTGVTEAMRYMEGLMPKSTKILPGAAMGYAMGGIPGMLVGGVLNAYIQPQLEEGPLSFLALIPPAAPFVADLTKTHEELRDIYSGDEWVAIRKGRNWPIGQQPIEGGRISRYQAGWYPLLKAQVSASPALYGSKLEQFMFKDLPLLDFSFGDIIDPHYLERKHRKDRPYSEPDIPFDEIPIIGPTVGAILGRAYLAIHPLGSLHSPLRDETISQLEKGVGFNIEEGYGPKYGGAFGNRFGDGNIIHGSGFGRAPVIQSAHGAHQIIAEQVYKGIIEPPGLLGWATSALLWGGDEPYIDEPAFASASDIDSFSRQYWDLQLGDPLLLSEGIRRLIPRPRTSFEKVNPLKNTMPRWLPEEFKCITKNTLVEIDGSRLTPAGDLKVGDIIRTHKGSLAPITSLHNRPMKPQESLFNIQIGNLRCFNHQVSEEHPFWTPEGWKEIKDINIGDYVGYPIPSLDSLLIKETIIDVSNYVGDEFKVTDKYVFSSGYSGKHKIPRFIDINTKEFGIIQGYFIAEGCTSGGNQMDISLNIREIEYSQELRTAFKKVFNYTLRRVEQKQYPQYDAVIRWKAYSTLLTQFFANFFGTSPKNKLLSLTANNWKDSLRTLFNGDGSFFENGEGEFQCNLKQSHNKELRYQVWQIALANKIIGADNGKYWYISNGYWFTKIVKKDELPQEELVSVSIDGDSSFCLPGVATHNTGDPYCLCPDTMVETEFGLQRADEIKAGDLVRTINGRYFPVSKISAREVDETVYRIKIAGINQTITATSKHPFAIRNPSNFSRLWTEAGDLSEGDYVTYPLLRVNTPTFTKLNSWFQTPDGSRTHKLPMNVDTACLMAILMRYGYIINNCVYLIDTISKKQRTKFTDLVRRVFGPKGLSKIDDGYVYRALVELQTLIDDHGVLPMMYSAPLTLLTHFLSEFILEIEQDKRVITFQFPNYSIAYQIWSVLLQKHVVAKLDGNKLICPNWYSNIFMKNKVKNKILWSLITGLPENYYSTESLDYACLSDPRGWKEVYFQIESIEKVHYKGLVYGYQVNIDDTFCVAGCLVHNTRIPMGEALLPGAGYESLIDVNVNFPTGGSRLGYTAYEQALHMVGLADPIEEDAEEILDTGTAIHRMVQANLTRSGVISKAEAFVTDPYNNISSYVDGVMKSNSGGDIPLEIKTINARGFQKLSKPKHKHIIQLNSYLHMMKAPRGTILYVNREDPSLTKTFEARYNPKLWLATLDELETARTYASDWVRQGYGTKMNGYSYLDRLQVLMNADPFSKEFRETAQIVEEQKSLGLFSPEQEQRYEKVRRWQQNMTHRYEMRPHRFSLNQIIDPDPELQQYNTNELIKAAAEYGPFARVAGSIWEKFTSLRSPIHTKLIGNYSPEEQYERSVLYGSSFYDWTKPVDTMLKPWGRGLRSVTDPIQGAISFGIGAGIFGGPPGMILGGTIGAAYGAVHGAYRKLTGTRYIPEHFEEMQEIQQYFDRLKYDQAQYMWMATKDPKYQKAMQQTAVGWVADARRRSVSNKDMRGRSHEFAATTMQNSFFTPLAKWMGAEMLTLEDVFDEGTSWTSTSREANSPRNYDMSPDLGFGSPWKGSDPNANLEYNALNIGGGIAAAPYWDRPFFTAFLNTPEDQQDRVLNMVDRDFGEMLKAAWRRGDVEMSMPDDYFEDHYKPPTGNPLNMPMSEIDDWKYITLEREGMTAHEFGVGWRSQIRRIDNAPYSIKPININAETPEVAKQDLSQSDVQLQIRKVLDRSGVPDANITVGGTPSTIDQISVRVKVNRDSSIEIARLYREGKRHART